MTFRWFGADDPVPLNGVTFCTGSLGAAAENDLPAMIRSLGARVHFMHCRNVRRTAEKRFHETPHPSEYGDVDLTLASVPVQLDSTRAVLRRIDGLEGKYDFYYAQRPGEWTPLLTNAGGTILSTRKAGGIVGTMLGIYVIAA
jgi:hypothetical protein